MVYRSPWIVQLKRFRPIQRVVQNLHPDTVIIGGGIAGIFSAYYLLRDTTHTVLVLEADKVAHGATGHNAGQAVSYFERPLHDIASAFGEMLAVEAYQSLLSTWNLVEDIYRTVPLRTKMTEFVGYKGFSTLDQIHHQLHSLSILHTHKINTAHLLVSKEAEILSKISAKYHHLCQEATNQEISRLLDTPDPRFIAAFAERKACTNSSLLTEELVGFLLTTYPDRFSLAEYTPVRHISPTPSEVTVQTADQTFHASAAILCTNGYKTFSIHTTPSNSSNQTPTIQGVIGYMSGYLDSHLRTAAAIQYFPEHMHVPTDPYYYITRRLYEHGRHAHTLHCIGGPEVRLPPGQAYEPHARYIPQAQQHIRQFIDSSYLYPPEKHNLEFQWHGLMGYTESMIRLVGSDPDTPLLLYNLGCNGVGILPSIYGAKRISEYLQGCVLKPSIFDPHLQRTLHKKEKQ